MAEYIKRMSAMTICERYSQHCFETNNNRGQDIADRIFDKIVKIPTADVVEVVRCKDCEYARIVGEYGCHCLNANTPWHNDEFEVYMDLSDFCSYGERKGDANE